MICSVVKRSGGVITVLTGFWLLLFVTACSDKMKVPSDVLDPEEMQAVMWDMIQADRYAAMYFPTDTAKRNDIKTETLKVYDQVFKIHDITQEEFVRSYKYYLSRPDISKAIFDSMYVQANRKREEENMARQREQQIKDSIANLKLKDSSALVPVDSSKSDLKDSAIKLLQPDTLLNKGKIDSLTKRPRLSADTIAFSKRRDSVLLRLRQRAEERAKRRL